MAEAVVKYWGIIILPVQIKPYGASRILNAALQSIAEGRAESLANVEKAIGIQATSAAPLKGMKDGLEGFSPEEKGLVLGSQALTEGMKKGPLIISSGEGGLANIIGQVSAIHEKTKKP